MIFLPSGVINDDDDDSLVMSEFFTLLILPSYDSPNFRRVTDCHS